MRLTSIRRKGYLHGGLGEGNSVLTSRISQLFSRLGFQSVLDFGYGDTKRYFQEFLAEMGRFDVRISTFQVTYAFVEWLAERDIFVEGLMNVDQASGLDGEQETEYDWEDVKRKGLPQHLRVRSLFPVHRMPQPLRMWSRNRVYRLRQYSSGAGRLSTPAKDVFNDRDGNGLSPPPRRGAFESSGRGIPSGAGR